LMKIVRGYLRVFFHLGEVCKRPLGRLVCCAPLQFHRYKIAFLPAPRATSLERNVKDGIRPNANPVPKQAFLIFLLKHRNLRLYATGNRLPNSCSRAPWNPRSSLNNCSSRIFSSAFCSKARNDFRSDMVRDFFRSTSFQLLSVRYCSLLEFIGRWKILISCIHCVSSVVCITGIGAAPHRDESRMPVVFLAPVRNQAVVVHDFTQIPTIRSVYLFVIEAADLEAEVSEETIIYPCTRKIGRPMSRTQFIGLISFRE
jgi:hypothetical protein